MYPAPVGRFKSNGEINAAPQAANVEFVPPSIIKVVNQGEVLQKAPEERQRPNHLNFSAQRTVDNSGRIIKTSVLPQRHVEYTQRDYKHLSGSGSQRNLNHNH